MLGPRVRASLGKDKGGELRAGFQAELTHGQNQEGSLLGPCRWPAFWTQVHLPDPDLCSDLRSSLTPAPSVGWLAGQMSLSLRKSVRDRGTCSSPGLPREELPTWGDGLRKESGRARFRGETTGSGLEERSVQGSPPEQLGVCRQDPLLLASHKRGGLAKVQVPGTLPTFPNQELRGSGPQGRHFPLGNLMHNFGAAASCHVLHPFKVPGPFWNLNNLRIIHLFYYY